SPTRSSANTATWPQQRLPAICCADGWTPTSSPACCMHGTRPTSNRRSRMTSCVAFSTASRDAKTNGAMHYKEAPMREGESHLERLARKQQEGREQRRGKHQNDPSNKLEASQAAPPALDIDAALDVFNHWLILKDATPVLAALGCVAAN